MSLDIEEIVRATKYIETLHETSADWGRVHRWLAERYLRSGQRREALGEFMKAAVLGQARGVISDLGAILQRRVLRRFPKAERQGAMSGDAWAATATAWLREFDKRFQ